MLDRIGHSVIKLVRTKINGIELGGLDPGTYRFLTPDELKKLQKEVLSPN